MKELQKLIKRVEVEINKTPTGELRNLLCDANIVLQQQALNIPVVSNNEVRVTVCTCKHPPSERKYYKDDYQFFCFACCSYVRTDC